jgi:hypothetical protein
MQNSSGHKEANGRNFFLALLMARHDRSFLLPPIANLQTLAARLKDDTNITRKQKNNDKQRKSKN